MQNPIIRLHYAGQDWSRKYGVLVVWLGLGVLALGLIYWRIIRGYSPPISYVPWPEPPEWVQTLYALRWSVRAILVIVGIVLLYTEWAGNALSRWMKTALEHRLSAFMLSGTIALLLGSYLIQPGHVGTGDAQVQRSSAGVIWDAIRDGQWWVYWTNYAFFGSPFGQFHNSLYYYLIAFANLLTHNFFYATEFTQLGLHVISALFMYLYVHKLTKSAPAALVSALAWSATFYRYHLIVILGKLPYGLYVCLWPLQFFLIESVIENSSHLRRNWAALVITVSLMLWTHVLYGTWSIALGVFYAVARLSLPWPRAHFRAHLGRAALIAAAHIAALVPAAYQIIPTLFEANLTRMGDFVGAREFTLPTISLENVLVFKGSYLADWFGGFIGNSIIAIALIALIVMVIQRYWRGVVTGILLATTLFMTFVPHYWPKLFDAILGALPLGTFAYAAKSSGIYLMVVIGPLAVLTGAFVNAMSELVVNRWPALAQRSGQQFLQERIALVISTVILLELIPVTLSVNFKYPDEYIDGFPARGIIMDALASTPDKHSRVIDLQVGIVGSYTISMLTGHPGLFGHWEEATGTVNTLLPLIKTLADETRLGALSPETAKLLYQLDIGYLITDESISKVGGLEAVIRTERAVLWKVPGHAPLVADSSPVSGNEVVMPTLAGGDVPVSVIRYDATSVSTTVDFSLPQRAFVQTAYASYPYQYVILDGERTNVTTTSLGLIGFWAEAGSHTVEVLPELSPLRKITLTISAAAALIATVLVLYPRRQS